jgi:hypothetical protein
MLKAFDRLHRLDDIPVSVVRHNRAQAYEPRMIDRM